MNTNIIELLMQNEIFCSFTQEDLDIIAENCEISSFNKNDVLFNIGDPSRSLFVVAQGEVCIIKCGENNTETEIARYMKSNCFGELSFLTGSPRNAVARCEDNTSILSFPKSGVMFEDILKIHPAFSAKFLHHLLVLIAGRLRLANSLIKENTPIIQELKKQVYLDKMTGIYNKTYMEEKLSSMLASKPSFISYISIKPDNFKDINDTYGHEAGDEAIKLFAHEIKKIIKDEELLSRYMGNEMTILLEGYDRTAALSYAEKLKNEIMKINFEKVTNGNTFNFTISMGIAVYPTHSRDIAEIISKARELPLISRANGGGMILFPDSEIAK